MRRFGLMILFVLACCQDAFPQPPLDGKLRAIRTDLQMKVEKKEIASAAIGVIRSGRVVWKEAFGWADREKRIRATPNTIYPLASLSKSITATGLWLLVEQGTLSIDDPVAKHLRSVDLRYFQGNSSDLRIRHLLNMEGGIPHQFEYFYDEERPTPPALPEQIRRYGFVAFPPGAIHHYSNFSMGMLDQLIADASRSSFADYMKSSVFTPLGMQSTFVDRPSDRVIAKGYDQQGNQVLPSLFHPRGGAGAYSTLDDLLNFGLGHLNRKEILRSETLDRMHRPMPNSPNPYYSSGWGVLPTSDGRVSLISNGAIAGTATTLLLVPKEDLVIVCLTNTTVGNEFTDSLAFKIAGTLLAGYEQSLDKLFEEVEPLFSEKPFVADKSYFGEWAGEIKTRQGNFPIKVRFQESGETFVSLAGQNEVRLTGLNMEKGLLKGKFAGTIGTKEALRFPHQISLELMKDGEKLFGIATAQSDRTRFYLPYYVELKAL